MDPGDSDSVAGHLLDLWTDEELHERMSAFARRSISDEVSTVGNALSWFYLADMWVNKDGVTADGRWVNDMAREEAGIPYHRGENKLPREI